MNIIKKVLRNSLLMISLIPLALNAQKPYTDHIVHFADENEHLNRLITLNYDTMTLLNKEKIEGSLNHHADPLGKLEKADYMMLVPKGSNFVNIHEIKTGDWVKKIRLPFRPRSADAYNKKFDLVLLNSRDRPAAVLIDATKLKMVGKAGFDITCNLMGNKMGDTTYLYDSKENLDPNLKCDVPDNGGDQVSGHPLWLDAYNFVIIDRSNRLLHIYGVIQPDFSEGHFKTFLKQTLYTSTSLHQLIPEDNENPNNTTFYGMTEGNPALKIIPRIYKYKYENGKLDEVASMEVIFSSENNIKTIGTLGHNLYITPDKQYLYAPLGLRREQTKLNSYDPDKGGIFVVNTKTMKVENFIKAGKGAGHVAFSEKKNLAVVTNHMDKYVTVIDYKKHRLVKDIDLGFSIEGNFNLTQSHMQHISEDGEYYYNFWLDDGIFFRVNLSTLKMDHSIPVGGVPIQGNFYDQIAQNDNILIPDKDDGFDDLFQPDAKFTGYIEKSSNEDANSSNGYTR